MLVQNIRNFFPMRRGMLDGLIPSKAIRFHVYFLTCGWMLYPMVWHYCRVKVWPLGTENCAALPT
jgi:hypothetical protein